MKEKKKPEVTPELIKACKKYKEIDEKFVKLHAEENALYKEQRPYEKTIERFVKKSIPKLRALALKVGMFKIQATTAGYIRKVS